MNIISEKIQVITPRVINVQSDLFSIIEKTYESIYHIITIIALAFAVCAIIYASIKYIISNGDAKLEGEAKNALIRVSIGIIVIIITYGIINLGKSLGGLIEKKISNNYTPPAQPSPHPSASPSHDPYADPENLENNEPTASPTGAPPPSERDEIIQELNRIAPAPDATP